MQVRMMQMNSTMILVLCNLVILHPVLFWLPAANAFITGTSRTPIVFSTTNRAFTTSVGSNKQQSDDIPKKKRKRKQQRSTTPIVPTSTTSAAPPTKTLQADPISRTDESSTILPSTTESDVAMDPEKTATSTSSEKISTTAFVAGDIITTKARISDKERSLIEEIAKLELQRRQQQQKVSSSTEISSLENSDLTATDTASSIPLPNIQDVLRQKKKQEELAQQIMEQDEEEQNQKERVKIKRSDRAAFTKLLEQQPFADADDSFFEPEEYSTVSALLGERAQPFLGIPSGPLQVGHFVGALGIALMAFIEYPGFPLTNLPSPLRQALQGGLATIYLINIALAVYAVQCANVRGQPIFLWVAKTLSVGGLALDQLTQLPTLEQIRLVEARKGARALKKNNKRTSK